MSPRYRKTPLPAAQAERELLIVHRPATRQPHLLPGLVHLCGGDAGAELNVVRAAPIGWPDKPSAEIFLSTQIRFRERWSAKGDTWLRAQQ
jgi:hypothetical protein